MDDAALVQEAVGGSVPAFNEIFDRYQAQVHDAALALLRDRQAALQATQVTFRKASEHLEALRRPERLRVWLLAILRFHVAGTSTSGPGPDRLPAGNDPVAERAQHAALVWEAPADLPLRERALSDFFLRQRLDDQDLADALGITLGELDELKSSLEVFEKGLAGYVLVRRDERRCPDLPLVLRGWDGRFTPLICTHIAAHVDRCRICREAAEALPSPLALYASAPQAPLPGTAAPAGANELGSDL
jgi:DNA-directed RNA polymerase specialized sigma24 family protein